MELSELKRDRNLLLAVLKIQREGQHLPCPFHGGGKAFCVWRGDDGVWLWKCNSTGCGWGTVVDAAMKMFNVQTCRDAINALEKELGIKIGRDEDYIEPRIDVDRAEAFIKDAHDYLMNSTEVQEQWLKKKRGIENLETVQKYRLGFVDGAGFHGKNWRIFGWVLPVTDAAGHLVGVKLHTERPPWPEGPKCLWAPFGTYPVEDIRKGIHPKHGPHTLWPPPEHHAGVQQLYFCPGELKALAMIAAGLPATAPTNGENKLPDRLVQRIAAAKPGSLAISYDDDKPKMINGKMVSHGNVWKDSMIEAFKPTGIVTLPFAFRSEPMAPLAPTIPAEDTTVSHIASTVSGTVVSGPVEINTEAPGKGRYSVEWWKRVTITDEDVENAQKMHTVWWTVDEADFIQVFEEARRYDTLPDADTAICPWLECTPETMWDLLAAEIKNGPGGPHAKSGELMQSLRKVRELEKLPF
ncbi:MAG: hypothetical protein WC100_03505 [Sterolibacterium sp.]